MAELKYDRFIQDTTSALFREKSQRWLGLVEEELVQRLGPVLQPGIGTREIVHEVLDIFRGLETSAQIDGYIRHRIAVVQPVQRLLGYHVQQTVDAEGFKHSGKKVADRCYDLPIVQVLARLLQEDDRAWSMVNAKSKEWSRRAVNSSDPAVFRDVTDGKAFTQHPRLGIAARTGKDDYENGPVKVALELNYDGLEVRIRVCGMTSMPLRVPFRC